MPWFGKLWRLVFFFSIHSYVHQRRELLPFNLRFPFVICIESRLEFMHEQLLKHSLGSGYELEG
jgi:hypothetical protein